MKSDVEELINRIIDESNRKAIAEAEYDGKKLGEQKALENSMDVEKKLKEVKDNMLDENPVNIALKSIDDCIYEGWHKGFVGEYMEMYMKDFAYNFEKIYMDAVKMSFKEGHKDGIREVAKKLRGILEPSEISEITGLTIEEIKFL